MNHWSYLSIWKTAFIGVIVVACCHPPTISAQDPPLAQSIDDDPDSIRQGGLTSLSLVRQQSTIQAMELIRETMRRKDFLAAVPLMERILTEPNSFVPFNSITEIGTHEEVRRLMDQLPADLKQRLNEPRRTSARVAWEQASRKSQADVVAFLQRFGDLPLGIEAWWWIGCRERDHSRPRTAASAFARVSSHPEANGKQKLMALVAEWESAVEAGMSERIHLLRERLNQFRPTTEIVLEGQRTTLGDWLGSFRESAVSTTQPSVTDDPRSRSLVLPAKWQTEFPRAVRKEFEAAEHKWRERQREQGVRPFSILRPTIVGDLAIMRSLDAIRACDIKTGEIRWSIPNVEYQEIDLNWTENSLFLTNAIEWALRRSSADSIFGRLTAHGSRIFAVQEPDRLGEFKINRGNTAGSDSVGPHFNKLCCYSLESGALEWEIGGKNVEGPFASQIFLSAPLIVDDLLYVIAQRDLQMSLFAIEAQGGSPRWSMELGTVTLAIADDRQRSRVGCPIVWHEGLLLCSTSAGVVIAVDPLLQSSKWGYRYPATTIAMGELRRSPNLDDVNNGFEPWWDRWREPFVAVTRTKNRLSNAPVKDHEQQDTSVLIFASPETEQLHAVRSADGEPLWRIAREGGLMIAGIVDQTVIVIEGDAVRGHDTATGNPLWRIQTPEIGGPGFFDDSILVLPAASGGLILADGRSGRLVSESTSAEPLIQSLAKSESGWIAAGHRTLACYPVLSDIRRDLERELQKTPDSQPLMIQAARLESQLGNPLAAIKRLDSLSSPEADEVRRLAIIDVLRSSEPDLDRSRLARQLKELSSGNERLLTAAVVITKSNLSSGDLVNAVDAALEGLTLDLDLSETLIKDAEVNVRPDRLLLGLIEQALRRASPDQKTAIDSLFAQRVRDARKNRDRFAVQQLARQWQGLDFGRQLVVREDDRVSRRRSFTAIEFRLLDAAGSNDKQVATEALEILARRLETANADDDANAIRQRIAREQISADPKARETSLKAATKSNWPAVDPVEEVTEKRQAPRGIYSLLPMHAETGSLAARLDIYIDRNGNEIQFRMDSQRAGHQGFANESGLKLPPSASPFRGSVGYMLREAWGVGRIVILLVGGDLIAIAPVDEKGELNPSFLWSSPVDIQGSPRDTRVLMGKSGINEGRHLVIDQLNRPIGRIGPVRANYLCFQRGSKLVAVETETGRTLWERLNLPADITVIGDDHFVYLWHENRLLEKLSALDGHGIDERKMTVAPSQMLHHRDSIVWTVMRGEQFTLEADDLRSGNRLWHRSQPRETRATVLDAETLAMATPDGKLHVLVARTGENICDPLAIDTTSLTGLAAWQDSERWYLALMRPPVEGNAWKSQKPSDSYRRILVNGTLIAIDRANPQIIWRKELIDEAVPLDQPQTAPLLVQAWRTPSMDDSRVSECTFRALDKQTGKVVLERRGTHVFPNFLLNARPENGILEVELPNETVRLRYPSPDKQ